jgi:glycosyltransferase involved in cell wall biosynthesis
VRILLLVDAYFPGGTSQAKLMRDLGVELRRRGHEVVVVTPSDAVRSPLDVRTEDDLLVARVRTGRLKGTPRLLRAIREERLSAMIWRAARRFFATHRCDVVVFYSPSIFFGHLAARLKRLWGCRTYLVLRDIFPQWAVDAGLIRKGGLAYRFFRWRETQQYDAADVIGVQSPANLDYFRVQLPRYQPKLEVLYSWTDPDPGLLPEVHLRRRLGLRDEVVFLFGGNLGVANGLDAILRLARSVRHDGSMFFVLMGGGTEVARLERRITEESLTNVKLLPALNQLEYLAALREVDVGLISLGHKLRTDNYPGKFLGYIQSSLPVLASINPESTLGALLVEHDAGRWANNDDDAELVRQATVLAHDRELRRRLGANARRLLEARFSVGAAVDQILEHAG